MECGIRCAMWVILAALLFMPGLFGQNTGASSVFDSLAGDYLAWGSDGALSEFINNSHRMVTSLMLEAEVKKLSVNRLGLLNIKIALLLPLDGEYAERFEQGEYCGGRVREVGVALNKITLGELKERCRFLGVPESRATFLRHCIDVWVMGRCR